MTATLYIPVGIPGSGKSTWARDRGLRIVSTDDIRLELFGTLTAANDPTVREVNNAMVFQTFHDKIAIMLRGGTDVVADATNLHASARRTLRKIARESGAHAVVVLFDNIGQAVQRNNARLESDPDRFVPDEVMDKMIMQFVIARESLKGEQRNGLLQVR
jgi:predicted kinase